jgi:hypothetical protein
MKSKLVGVCVTLVACAVWWTGCSSDPATGTNNPDGGGGTPEGGSTADSATPDSSGGTDAATDTGVDAALSGPFLPISYGAASCPAFAACGGNVKGSWTLTGGCVTEALFAPAKAQCAGIVESNVKIEARGTVVADAVTITRKTDVRFSATLAVPGACLMGGSCAQLGPVIVALAKLKTAACVSDGGTGCTCNVTNDVNNDTADAYTIAGNTLTTGAGASARTYDYCVAANEIKYKETTAATDTPAIFVLTK